MHIVSIGVNLLAVKMSIGRENDEMANMKYMHIGSNTSLRELSPSEREEVRRLGLCN